MKASHYYSQLLLLLVSLLFLLCDGVPKKLRRYKICNGGKCKAIRSSKPPSFLQEMDSFLYSRWTRWATCTRHCTTKRYRACKFPLICGNTVIHEEAFCYHRGTYCEYIFENNKRDYLASDDTDYLDDADYEFQSNEHERHQLSEDFSIPAQLSDQTKLSEETLNDRTLPISTPSYTINRRQPAAPSPKKPRGDNQLSQRRFQRNNYTDQLSSRTGRDFPRFKEKFEWESEGPFPVYDDAMARELPRPQTCGVPRTTDRNRNGITTRILGGQEAMQGRWPWQVAVLNRMNEAFCGGTLIAPRWILTAAHCIRKRLQVTIGEHHLHRNDGTERHYKIDAAFIHPDFDHETVDNDIALLLLPEPVPIEAGVACMPSENQLLPTPGTLCTILGWGKERHTHIFGTTVLHEGKVPLVTASECRYTYGQHEITDNMFCAGYRGGTVDSCAGDSGGPILCSVDNRWTAFGVTSFGDGCGRKGKFGIYAKVPNYVGWINKVMKANDYLN